MWRLYSLHIKFFGGAGNRLMNAAICMAMRLSIAIKLDVFRYVMQFYPYGRDTCCFKHQSLSSQFTTFLHSNCTTIVSGHCHFVSVFHLHRLRRSCSHTSYICTLLSLASAPACSIMSERSYVQGLTVWVN